MEDDFDNEVIRLRKLLEDRLMQADKENMTILQSSTKIHGHNSHPVKQNSRSLPAVKQYTRSSPPVKQSVKFSSPIKQNARFSPPIKQNARFSQPIKQNAKVSPPIKQNVGTSLLDTEIGTDVDVRDTHSRIHFLRDMETSLLSKYPNRRVLVTDSRNKYTPCAIPLSPPIRLKKDAEERIYSHTDIQSEAPVHTTGKTTHTVDKASPIPTCGKSAHTVDKASLIHTCGKSTHAVDRASLIHTCGRSEYASNTSNPENSCNKSPRSNIVLNEKNFPPTPVNNVIQSAATISERELNTQVKNAFQNTSFVYTDSFQHSGDNLLSDRKINISPIEKKILELRPGASSAKDLQNSQLARDEDKDENTGFHLRISLDSCSTKDVINTMLSKIPEIANKFAASCDLNDVTCSASVQREEKRQSSVNFLSDSYSNISDQSKIAQQKCMVSACTQTMLNSFNMHEHSRFSEKVESQIVSSSTQTDQNKELSANELKHLVKEIVLDALQNPDIIEQFHIKGLSIPQKVDSGIQSEIESDVPEHGKMIGNKDVQVNLDSYQHVPVKYLQDKSSNTENFQVPVKLMTFSNREHLLDNSSTVISENNLSPVLNSNNKMEEMLEKIYDHICQEKEISKDTTDAIFRPSILTREVAVQFNPLHTSTKSTLTSPIKQVDSSSQYDDQLNTNAEQKLGNASQAGNYTGSSNLPFPLVDSYTQCEDKVLLNSTTQTEIIMRLEDSAASVSSTPVSDSMYIDDLLSEGEISLPWNLRLLSNPGESMNASHADSTDTSIKEKDYSLSEGEIHPNVIRYFTMQHSNFLEDNVSDTFQDMHPAKLETDSRHTLLCDKVRLGQSTGRNLRLDVSNSSVSEGEYNTSASLSLGEISPGFRSFFLDASQKADVCMSSISSFSGDKLERACDNASQASGVAQHLSSLGGELPRDALQTHAQSSSQSVLQTVDEEVHSMFD